MLQLIDGVSAECLMQKYPIDVPEDIIMHTRKVLLDTTDAAPTHNDDFTVVLENTTSNLQKSYTTKVTFDKYMKAANIRKLTGWMRPMMPCGCYKTIGQGANDCWGGANKNESITCPRVGTTRAMNNPKKLAIETLQNNV